MLIEITKYDYNSNTEDRITQVLSGCLNSSASVRNAFLKYLGCKTNTQDKYFFETQIQKDNDSRPDIFIKKNGVLHVVIESKTLSTETRKQLSSHEKFKADKYFLITQFRNNIKIPQKWTRLCWHDFALQIHKKAELFKRNKNNTFDEGVCIELDKYFEEPGWPLENPPPVAGSKSPTLRLAERVVI